MYVTLHLMPSRFTKEHRRRFWKKVSRGKKKSCWKWQFGCTKAGYGQLQIRAVSSQPLLAHRVAWELTNGPIPEGLHILHECDNTKCCNPNHLFLGTQRDNNLDRDMKGRTASGDRNGARTKRERNSFVQNRGSGKSGEDHPNSKLSDNDVKQIRVESRKGSTGVDLAKKYGVSPTQICRILKGKSRTVKR